MYMRVCALYIFLWSQEANKRGTRQFFLLSLSFPLPSENLYSSRLWRQWKEGGQQELCAQHVLFTHCKAAFNSQTAQKVWNQNRYFFNPRLFPLRLNQFILIIFPFLSPSFLGCTRSPKHNKMKAWYPKGDIIISCRLLHFFCSKSWRQTPMNRAHTTKHRIHLIIHLTS